jgi:WD40 repeat protein
MPPPTQVNVSSSIRYRQRSTSPSRRTLLDEECHTWQATYNRFKHFETIHGGADTSDGTGSTFFPGDRPTSASLIAATRGKGQRHPLTLKRMLGRGTPHANGGAAGGGVGASSSALDVGQSSASPLSVVTPSSSSAGLLNRGAQYRAAAGEEQSEIVSALSTWNRFASIDTRLRESVFGTGVVRAPSSSMMIPQQHAFLGHPQRRLAEQMRELSGPARRIDHNKSAARLAPHPFLPNYFAGAPDGSVVLWEVGCAQPLVRYCKPEHAGWRSGHISRVRVSTDGLKMAACDSSGQLALWRVCGGDKDIFPCVGLKCNSKRTLDTEFLNEGSVLATAGQSATHRNLCIWDTLMPPRVCRVAAINCGPSNGLYSMVYSDRYQQIVVGDGGGNLVVYDLRQRRICDTVEGAHGKAVMVLTRDPVGQLIASGSTDGCVKVWSLATSRLREVCALPNLHPQHTFVNLITSDSMISQRGVTDVVWTEQSLVTCGADGTVKLTPRNRFKRWK